MFADRLQDRPVLAQIAEACAAQITAPTSLHTHNLLIASLETGRALNPLRVLCKEGRRSTQLLLKIPRVSFSSILSLGRFHPLQDFRYFLGTERPRCSWPGIGHISGCVPTRRLLM